jgi:hypothetical protein
MYAYQEVKEGLFHQWGIDAFEERPSYDYPVAFVQRTVAIIELEDGQVAMYSPHQIRFIYD